MTTMELKILSQAVAANTTISDSAIVMLLGIQARLNAAIATGDPEVLKRLVDQLGVDTERLANALTANTPQAPHYD